MDFYILIIMFILAIIASVAVRKSKDQSIKMEVLIWFILAELMLVAWYLK